MKILLLLLDIVAKDETKCTSADDAATNVWCNLLPKTSWPLNQPISRKYHAMAAYTRFPNKTNAINRILLFGGKTVAGDPNSGIDAASSLRDTWTYSPRTHSWTLLELEVLPTARHSHSLTTICGSRVVLIGGQNCGDELVYCWGKVSVVHLNDTWMFNGETESWIRVRTSVRGKQGKFNFAFPVLGNRSSNCSCNENVYLLNHDGLAVHMWLLKCVSDGNGTIDPEYEWEYINTTSRIFLLSAAYVNYATSSVYLVTSTGSFREVLFFNATTRLWKRTRFRNIFHYGAEGLFEVAQGYFSNSSTVISTYGSNALALDIRDGRLLSISSRSKSRIVKFKSARSATIGEEMFVYGGTNRYGGFSTDSNMWKLEMQLNRSTNKVLLTWRRDNTPVIAPDFFSSSEAILSTVNNHILYYKGHYSKNHPVECVNRFDFWARFRCIFFKQIPEMWTLDIETLQWWRYDLDNSPSVLPFTSSVASYDYYMLLGYGLRLSDTSRDIVSTNEIWLYVDHLRLWVKLKQNKPAPKPRAFASFASLYNSSFLLFGGMSPVGNSSSGKVIVFNDLWMLNVAKGKGNTEFKIEWSQLLVSDKSSLFQLSPLFGHSAYYSKRLNSMYLIGGQSKIEGKCHRNILLQFNVSSITWARHRIKNANPSPIPNYMCQYKGALLGERIVISDEEISTTYCFNMVAKLIHNQSYTSIVNKYCSKFKGIYTLNFEEMKWIRLTVNEYAGYNREMLFSWKDRLISITDSKIENSGLVVGVIWQLIPSCTAGHYSENFTTTPCKICPTGTYSLAGDTSCTVCPEGMTTMFKGCTSVDNCTCITNYCHHGKCVPLLEKDRVLCECDPGFTDSRCSTPTYYIIGCGAFGLAILVGLLSGCIRVRWRRQKNALETAEEDLRKTEIELKEEKQAWAIDRRKLVIKEVIATGGFGIVHCGEYCGGRVAVKRIKHEIAEILKEDAGKEFSIMKIVRHKNIVQFLGAVELPEDPAPAFVVEFMERGSLRAILDDKTVDMDYKRKLCCASDAAEGMQYLHSLDPPRLHRDLKCANLLVDQNWCVKVGDFGCALLLKGTEERSLVLEDDDDDDNGINYAAEGDDIPLMSLHQDRLKYSSYTFGTTLWKAPEAILRRGYGTAADVYRYDLKDSLVIQLMLFFV